MKKLLLVLLSLVLAVPALGQTTTPYTTIASVAALKAMTNRPQVIQVVGSNPGIFNLTQGACSAADDIYQVQPTSGTTVCYTRMGSPYALGKGYFLDVTKAPYNADPTGVASSYTAFTSWWTDVCTNKLGAGYIPQGTYKLNGNATVSFDLLNCPMGVIVAGASMGNTVLNTSGNTASPNVFIGGSGGTAAAPTITNYSSFSGFTISGDINGTVLQLGRNGTGVGLADALDSFSFNSIIVTNANSAHSDTAAGCEVNNVVNSSFINVVCDAGITAPTAAITGAISGTAGVCRITVASTTAFAVNMPITTSSIGGATACNGTFAISAVVDATHLELAASTFAGVYTSGGTVTYWIGYGDGLRLVASAFSHYSGSFGLANCGVAYRLPTGYSGIAYGNTFDNMDVEFVNNGVCRVAASGPETYQGGQWAITGKNGYVVTSAVGSGANITLNNPNFGMPGNVANAIDPSNSSFVQITGFYANGWNLAGGGTILTSGQLGRGSLAFDGATEFGIGMKNTASGSAAQTYLNFLRGSTSVANITGTDAAISASGVQTITGAAGTFLGLNAASGTVGQLGVAGAYQYYWDASSFRPVTNNSVALGTSSLRWSDVQTTNAGVLTLQAATSVAVGGATIGSNALAVTGTSLFTGAITSALGTITTSQPGLAITQTWNNGAVTFTGLDVNVATSTKASDSMLAAFRYNGALQSYATWDGILHAGGQLRVAATGAMVFQTRSQFTSTADGTINAFANNGSTWSAFKAGVYSSGGTAGVTCSVPALGATITVTGGIITALTGC